MNNQKNHHENEIADVVHDGVTLKTFEDTQMKKKVMIPQVI